MFGNNWSGKLEYLYMDLGTVESTTGIGTGVVIGTNLSTRVTDSIFRAGINYHFSAGPSPWSHATDAVIVRTWTYRRAPLPTRRPFSLPARDARDGRRRRGESPGLRFVPSGLRLAPLSAPALPASG